MKKVVAINGSPRKNGNTAILLQRALEGAASTGAETTLVNLCDLNYRGCISCFSCKRKDNSLHGRCAMRDGLSPVLDQVVGSDVLFLGSPIYVNNITGAMQSFLERLVFMNLSYDNIEESYFKGRMNIGHILTMGMPAEMMNFLRYGALIENLMSLKWLFRGECEYITSNDTSNLDDYSKYAAKFFDEKHKAKVRDEQFPKDSQSAYDLGRRLTE